MYKYKNISNLDMMIKKIYFIHFFRVRQFLGICCVAKALKQATTSGLLKNTKNLKINRIYIYIVSEMQVFLRIFTKNLAFFALIFFVSLQHIIYFVGFSSQYSYTASLCRLVADALKTFSANPTSSAFDALHLPKT